jgi:SAM-dependent methyltransferase
VIDYERLYEFRHQGVHQAQRQRVWDEIAPHVHVAMGRPQRVLDPAAGRGEFINAVPARERWAVDAVAFPEATIAPEVHTVIGDILEVELPADHFDGVFVSNTLEHFTEQADIGAFLASMRACMAPGGRIAVLGPNFRYCAKEYFDFADHTIALTHRAVAEHLYAAGFEIDTVVARFLPYSFGGLLPPSPALTRVYLRTPIAWRLLGKQFFVVGTA